MPTLYRVTLPVGNLASAVTYYRSLLGDDGDALGAGLHGFSFAGASVVLKEQTGRPIPHSQPLYLAVDEPLAQVHYRALTLGSLHVDPQPSTLPTGEHAFLLRDPFGNALYLVDARTVHWYSGRGAGYGSGYAGASAPAAASPAAAQQDAATLSLQRDFLAAVKGGDLETVTNLIEIDPELIEATDASGVSAIMHAAYKQHHAIASLLLQKYSDLNLWEAAAFGRDERVAHLLDRGFKVTVFSPDGFTPLGLACFFGHPTTVHLLLSRGADPNAAAQNHMQVRPLHSTLARAAEDTVLVNAKMLIDAGADVNATQQGGYTPLHQAADRGHDQVVALLLDHGAKGNVKAANGRTPADLARAKNYAQVLALLKTAGG